MTVMDKFAVWLLVMKRFRGPLFILFRKIGAEVLPIGSVMKTTIANMIVMYTGVGLDRKTKSRQNLKGMKLTV